MSADPTSWSDEKLEAHAAAWCSLPLLKPGPLPTPVGHPENPDEPDDEDESLLQCAIGAVLGTLMVVGVLGLSFAAAYVAQLAPGVALAGTR